MIILTCPFFVLLSYVSVTFEYFLLASHCNMLIYFQSERTTIVLVIEKRLSGKSERFALGQSDGRGDVATWNQLYRSKRLRDLVAAFSGRHQTARRSVDRQTQPPIHPVEIFVRRFPLPIFPIIDFFSQ